MPDAFLFVGLPYLAFVVLVAGSVYRYRANPFSYSALSSQFLESRGLPWGTIPWHAGILILLVGHVIPVLAPGAWQALVSFPPFLIAVEALGVAAAVLAIVGLFVLMVRRVTTARLQQISSSFDVIVLLLLLAQLGTGLGVALLHRWGAQWSVGTTTPYLWSLVTLRPDLDLVRGLPPLMKVHLVGAWIVFMLVPFTRLVHMFSIPLAYLTRPMQRVLWVNPRRLEHAAEADRVERNRRHLVRGLVGVGAALALLSAGVLDKLLRFFSGSEMTLEEEAGLLRTRLERLEMTAEERELQLERMRRPAIRIARLGELSMDRGHYFIDYQMRPALAFRDSDGLPLLISAKCTHLGCTVSSEVDERGRVMCPCHVSYFDLATGAPNPGSPAKEPLPHLGWELRRAGGEAVAMRSPGGPVTGQWESVPLETLEVWILRRFTEGEGV